MNAETQSKESDAERKRICSVPSASLCRLRVSAFILERDPNVKERMSMRPNGTKQRLATGQPAFGLFVSSASGLTAELVGDLGFDWVLVDLQHGENNLGNLSPMLQAVSTTAATPFVRVASNDPTVIQRALDLGAYGIVVPLVNTPAEAEAAVRAAKYPPRGERSWGPIRGALYGGPDY